MAGRIAGLTVKIGADATPLQTALKGVDQQLRAMRSGLNDINRQLKFNPTSTTLLTQKQQLLKKSIEDTRSRLETLKKAQKEMDDKGVSKQSEDYQRLQREIVATEGKLKGLEKEYAQFASVVGAKMQGVGAKMKEIGQKATEAGQAITKGLTAPIVAMAGIAVKAFQDVDKGMDAIVKKTGATGEALNAMKDSAKNLATSIPTDFETAGSAVGQVATRFKLSGEELESLSGQFVKFAKLNNTDVSTSINSVQSAMAAFGISSKDAGDFLDTLNAVGQNTGANVDQLAQSMTTNAASLKALGYSASDAANFLGQLSVNGIDSSQVMAGLKKAFAQAAKEGKPLDQKLAELQDTMKNADTDTEAYAAALEVFGNRAGPALAAAIRDGRLSLDQLGTSLKDNVGNIDKTFEETLDPVDKFKMAVNQAKVAGADLGNALLTRVTPMIEKFQEWIGKLGDKFKNLSGDQQDMIVKIGLVAAAIGPVLLVVGKLTSLIGSLVMGLGRVISSVTAVATGMAGLGTTLGVVAGAIGVVAVAAFAYARANQKAIEEQTKFTEEQQASIDALKETTNAYNEATSARDKAIESVMGEYEKVEALKNEYNNLVDSNGKIKEGYEDRADYIKGELAEALGLEKSEIDELIDKNGKLKGAIDDVILSQKAQAILEADQDAYTQAMENKAKAAEKLGPAMDTLNKKQKELDEAEKEYKALLADYNAQDSKTKATKAWTDKMAEAKDKVDSLRGKVAEADAAVSKYSGTLEQSQAEIDRHEGFVKALADKDKGAIAQWIADYERGLKSRANATDKELQAQYKTEKKYLDDMIKARKSGDKRITDELLKQQEDRVKFAQQEAEAVTKAAAKEGQGVNKELQGAAKKILGIFPVKVGKAVSGSFSLPDIWAKVKEIGKGVAKAVFPQFFSSVKTKYFAAGYENPKLFTNPSVYGGAVFGDKGTSRGGELVYGRENLLKDIASVSGGTTINVTVNGAESPEAWADRFVQEYQLQTRTV